MDDPLTDAARKHAQLADMDDAGDRAELLGELLAEVPAIQRHLRTERQAEILTMRASGMTDAQIGERLNLHWARVSAIARGATAGGNDIRRRQHAAESGS